MNLLKKLKRLTSCWDKPIEIEDYHYNILKKLYLKNGLELKMTCSACPEQYDVFKDGVQVAYYRLRHGEFTVDLTQNDDENIYTAEPNGDGIFDDNERFIYMVKALRILKSKL
jgi:hypothetical protein